jgi:hypothetical protein
MKKVYLVLTGFAMLACQPQEPEVTPQNPYKAQITALHTLLTDQMQEMVNSDRFEVTLAPTVKAPDTRKARTHSEELEIKAPMSLQQIDLSSNFINQVWDVESTSGLHQMVDQYENQIAYSALSEEEKFELFTIGESVRVTAEFLDNGGEELVYAYVVANLPPGEPIPARGKDPCIEIKDVMQGAVWAGFGGAMVGGFYGCTVGTFTIPIAGTATGCVGGAVFGFAEGFFGGVIGGIGQQALFKCLMKSSMRFNERTGTWYDSDDLNKLKYADKLIITPAG